MNIDFHHATTYVVARMAGLDPHDAAIVAYAAQYVDDATNSGIVQFEDGLLYRRIATAHRTIDRGNWVNADNLLSWLPFHFLPGNDGLGPDAPAPARGRERLVCRKDSPLARAMTEACVRDAAAGAPYALHRLGIAAHVYADTWAHDGFVGLVDPLNAASDFRDEPRGKPLRSGAMRALGWVSRLVLRERSFPGHGMALGYPDLPCLKWSYVDWSEAVVRRRHPALFLEAAAGLHGLFVRFLAARGTPAAAGGLTPEQERVIARTFERCHDADPGRRHANWLRAVSDGTFGFEEQLRYQAKGAGSWKHLALGTTAERDRGDEVFAYQPGFPSSDWFLFHEAAKLHRAHVLEELLPRFGLAIARSNVHVAGRTASA